jgi:site-specific recombinase XerD
VSPLIATRDGGRCSRFDVNALLRRVAVQAGPALADVADRIHPHALRHAYVTIALEQDARIQHVQADVGHASIATTLYYDRGRRTRDTTAADLVEAAIRAAGDTKPN